MLVLLGKELDFVHQLPVYQLALSDQCQYLVDLPVEGLVAVQGSEVVLPESLFLGDDHVQFVLSSPDGSLHSTNRPLQLPSLLIFLVQTSRVLLKLTLQFHCLLLRPFQRQSRLLDRVGQSSVFLVAPLLLISFLLYL